MIYMYLWCWVLSDSLPRRRRPPWWYIYTYNVERYLIVCCLGEDPALMIYNIYVFLWCWALSDSLLRRRRPHWWYICTYDVERYMIVCCVGEDPASRGEGPVQERKVLQATEGRTYQWYHRRFMPVFCPHTPQILQYYTVNPPALGAFHCNRTEMPVL